MKIKGIFVLLIVIGLISCRQEEKTKYVKNGNVVYIPTEKQCKENKNHLLLDIKLQNALDSVFLDTRKMGRKMEVHLLDTDSTSSFVRLLQQICVDDSLIFKIKAQDFYQSLHGSVPIYLNAMDTISGIVWMRGKLDDLEHISYKKAFERSQIDNFIQTQRWNGNLDSASAIYYEKLIKTQNATQFTKAKINYVLKTLQDQLLYMTKKGEPFLYDVSDKKVLLGIHLLMQKMKKGESVRAVIPSEYAFGPSGNKVVPGYFPVIIEIEILEDTY